MSVPTEVPLLVREQLYQKLAPWQTRILRIHPSQDISCDIICDLLVADVITLPGIGLVQEATIVQYEALSYAWGFLRLPKMLRCNNLTFPVSDTVEEAIRHVRRKDAVRYVWIDGCCINQSDTAEKSQQVGMMFTIFEKASSVIAWLGLSSQAGDLIFAFIKGTKDEKSLDRTAFAPLADKPDHDSQELTPMHAAARVFIGSKALFRRTWIRQEFAAARDLVICCGPHVCAFNHFYDILDNLLPASNVLESWPLSASSSHELALRCFRFLRPESAQDLADRLRNRSARTLQWYRENIWFDQILQSSLYECTLPQDKVYAVLGIAKALTIDNRDGMPGHGSGDMTHGFPAIDYTKSVSQIYQDFVKHTMNVDQSLKCLYIFEDRSKRGDDLPTWAIDLRVNTPRYLLGPWSPWSIGRPDQGQNSTVCRTQDFGQAEELILEGRILGSIVAESSDRSSWDDGCPSKSLVRTVPKLHSSLRSAYACIGPLDEVDDIFTGLQMQCGYTLREINMHGDSELNLWVPMGVPYGSTLKFFCLASDTANAGDVIFLLTAAELPLVLRQMTAGWISLGPALLVGGHFEDPKLKQDTLEWTQRRVFRYGPVEMRFRDPPPKLETYVIV